MKELNKELYDNSSIDLHTLKCVYRDAHKKVVIAYKLAKRGKWVVFWKPFNKSEQFWLKVAQ
jgi:hypothetical protein